MPKRVREEGSMGILPHPYGVRPWGNFYSDSGSEKVSCRGPGLGRWLSRLNDDLLLDILSLLSATSLARVATVSKAMYVFTHHSELWQPLVLEEFQGDFEFTGNWKETFAFAKHQQLQREQQQQEANSNCQPQQQHMVPFYKHKPLIIRTFFSDRLFQPWHCAASPFSFSWLKTENISREDHAHFTLAQFIEKYESRNLPVILKGLVTKWPAYKKWSREWLLNNYGDKKFAVGPVQMTLRNYYRYHDAARGVEERPLYLFDKHFARICPELANDYTPPNFAEEDLFQLLGSRRPEYRWLIVGPRGSGSSFHIDPNATSAWNGVLTGQKRWILFPPHLTPPGVHPSGDKAEVASPVSIKEWYLNFYSTYKEGFPPGSGPLEGTCEAGELIFVPHGWWHLVWNLDDSIALTQNFVSRQNVRDVLSFLQLKPDQVSGLSKRDKDGVFERFRDAVLNTYPQIDLSSKELTEPTSSWTSLVGEPSSFSFSFNFENANP